MKPKWIRAATNTAGESRKAPNTRKGLVYEKRWPVEVKRREARTADLLIRSSVRSTNSLEIASAQAKKEAAIRVKLG